MTRAKTEYAEVEEDLQQKQFFALQEKLNALRNTNDRLWYWFKKEKAVYSKSIKAFSRMNRFFKRIETFLVKEYGEESEELSAFKRAYYDHVLAPMDAEQVHSALNKEIFEKKGISDIEMVYAMKRSDIKFPVAAHGVVNRLYSNMRPTDLQRQPTGDWNGMFLNNELKRDQDAADDVGGGVVAEEALPGDDDSESELDLGDGSGSQPVQDQREDYVTTPDADILGNSRAPNMVGTIEEEPDEEYTDSEYGDEPGSSRYHAPF